MRKKVGRAEGAKERVEGEGCTHHARWRVSYTHLYRLAEAHLVAEEYPSVPSLDGGGHSLALEREQRVLQGRCRRHLAVRETRHGDAASFWRERYQRTFL